MRASARRDLARHERFAAHRGFMVEQDPVAGEQAVRLAIIDRDPIGIHLGDAVGRPRVEGCGLALRDFLHLAEHLGRRGLIETSLLLEPENADRLEQTQGAERVGVRRVFGRFEGYPYVALCRQIIDFVRLHLLDDPDQIGRVGQIPIMQFEPHIFLVRILVKMIDAIGIER